MKRELHGSVTRPFDLSGTVCEIEPGAISGIATNTEAGIELSRNLTGLPALNLHRQASTEQLQPLLLEKLPDGNDG